QLWKTHTQSLAQQLDQAESTLASAEDAQRKQQQKCNQRNEAYLKVGGADIETLRAPIEEKHNNVPRCERHVQEYKRLANALALPDALTREAVAANQAHAEAQLLQIEQEHNTAKEHAYEQGSILHQANKDVRTLQEQLAEAQARPDSNIRPEYQRFRTLLANELALTDADLPFVGELVQVKHEEAAWRGAIERAIDRKSTRLNSSHVKISYAVFCLKK